MLSKLIHRPVAVLLTIFAAVILGLLAAVRLPVGLLPEVGIPRISVQLSYPNAAARTVERAVVAPLRQQLLQLTGLTDIHSHAYDERAVIYLDFPFGTDPDLAFIEANEKVDQAMNALPRGLPRPRVMTTDISDLPIVDVAVTLKDRNSHNDGVATDSGESALLELSELARRLLRRRLEQLPEIAFADLSGQLDRRVTVIPDRRLLSALQLSETDIATLLTNANLETGNLLLADGHYVYNVRLTNRLRTVADLEALTLSSGGRLLRLGELAEIRTEADPARGYFFQDGHPGVIFSLRKQADARLFDLRDKLAVLLEDLRATYPAYDFTLLNDQTAVLTASIDNLKGGLLYGAAFAILVLFIFFREWRRPLLIGLAVPVALIIALLGFYLTDLSLNVVSLAGLILGLGLMIDNSIIVLDNVRQLRRSGLSPTLAAQRGADEVIRPLISSALTTVAVFLPLVLLGGVAGVLFRDQAVAVTLSLTASLLVAYFLLPLLSRGRGGAAEERGITASSPPPENSNVRTKSYALTLSVTVSVLLLAAAAAYALTNQLEVTGFPALSRNDYRLRIDWNRTIPLAENRRRSLEIAADWRGRFGGHSATEAGEHRYLLNEENRAVNAAELRFSLPESSRDGSFAAAFIDRYRQRYPGAIFDFGALPNLFDRIFAAGAELPLTIKVRSAGGREAPEWALVQPVADRLNDAGYELIAPARTEVIGISLNYDKLFSSKVDAGVLRRRLVSLFGENEVIRLREGDRELPVVVFSGAKGETLSLARLRSATVANRDGNEIPMELLVSVRPAEDYKRLSADRAGLYSPLHLPTATARTDLPALRTDLHEAMGKQLLFQLEGSLLTDRQRVTELVYVLAVSLLLLYLILAAQFESLRLPLVVLLVVPVSLLGTLCGLWVGGQSLNLVSLIGMIVTGGIVVNDAIIKLEMIQRGREQLGLGRSAAIRYAHRRRIHAILMTSITTVLALAPVLFTGGLGAELQRPLAIAVIGGLAAGTLASVYFLPLLYVVFDGRE